MSDQEKSKVADNKGGARAENILDLQSGSWYVKHSLKINNRR